ncbi:MAG: hypothetical protein P8076_07005 [Gammaproteobacteria bacterium]
MLQWALLVPVGLGLFGFGYYIGNQLGRTEHIREHLRRVREAKRADGTEWSAG